MNALTKQNFRPPTDLIRAAENLMVAIADERMIRPVVEAYEHAILAKHQFPPAEEYLDAVEEPVILDRKNAWLLSDEDFKVYNAECFVARDAAGLKVTKPENCPLLEAEHMRINAENELIKQLGQIQGLETFRENNCVLTLDQRAAVIAIGLKLAMPFIDNGQGVLLRYMNG